MTYMSLGCGCGAVGCGCGCSGVGGLRQAAAGFGRYVPMRGFGADVAGNFNAASVWSDWSQGTMCGTAGPDLYCAEATRAVNMIRAALAKLGYGELPMGQPWGSLDQAAYKAWARDASLNSPAGMPLKDQLSVMELQLSRNLKPGPKPAVSYEEVPGGGATFLEMKTLGIAGAVVLGLALVGGLSYMAYKQRKHHHHLVTHAEPAKA